MRQKLILVFITAVMSLFMGCSLQTTVPPMAKYQLDMPLEKTEHVKGPYSDKIVRMEQLESSTMLSGRMIVYTADNGQSYSYTKARWMESINRQLSNLMMRSLSKSGIFKDVIAYRSKAKSDYLLETGVYDFSQKVHDDGTSEVHLMIKVRLVDRYSRKVLSSRTFEYTETGLQGNVEGAIKGYNQLVQKYLKALNSWLSKG